MLSRHASERPQRVLQALGQSHEALAAEHHMSMLEAGECEAEVVEPVDCRWLLTLIVAAHWPLIRPIG